MKTISLLLILFISVNCRLLSQSIYPEHEIIVKFKSGNIAPPVGKTTAHLEEFQISSSDLRKLLQNFKVETVSRLIADFQSEDRFDTNRAGKSIELTDWTNIYILQLDLSSSKSSIDDLISKLNNRSEVVYAEINGRGAPDLLPNDQYFYRQWSLKNDGSSEQGSGAPGADINVDWAWGYNTGSSSVKVAIVDNGMQTNHPDFTGRVTGDNGDNSEHGTAVTGIAAAKGNNTTGIAGVAWNVGIINEDYGAGSDADFANAIISAANRGADIINNSWKLAQPVGRYSSTVRSAFADAYKLV